MVAARFWRKTVTEHHKTPGFVERPSCNAVVKSSRNACRSGLSSNRS
ncbi:hypothetical protein ACFFX0_09860 [Citricoccus parietis]|uniref:Uncharacterized protein n=1 Tax=Citricoccus parietis TaxID=592307 RepID=A0ABV5FXT5_9MICC